MTTKISNNIRKEQRTCFCWSLIAAFVWFNVILAKPSFSQEIWHNRTRTLRYHPDGNGFVIVNGTHRFNRALYGSHTGFRVEAGDLPEFALYLPGMGGTLRLGLIRNNNSKWVTGAELVEARYEPGTMIYRISDPWLIGGIIHVQVLALPDADGMIVKIRGEHIPSDTEVLWTFGGVTGKRFSREGDLGADPESVFNLKPEYCKDNELVICDTDQTTRPAIVQDSLRGSFDSFKLYYGSVRDRSDTERYENNYIPSKEKLEAIRLRNKKLLTGFISPGSEIRLGDASCQDNPLSLFQSGKKFAPVVTGKFFPENNKDFYLMIVDPSTQIVPASGELSGIFRKADEARGQLANRIRIDTPDDYINAACANLSTAADAIWDGQSFMHGAVAWRMPLNGWRGAYAADWLGWHDRAETYFRGYYAAQYTEPEWGPCVPDPATHLSRQKEEAGISLFTSGYISRYPGKISSPNHYDMNLVFIDQVLWHFRWIGDTAFLRESWPVIERHLAWEKRNFDAGNDGLYDAYCCIWASDALQYGGGGVTHSSAYNYRANLMAAELAPLIGKDPGPYLKEAGKIKKAVDSLLWMSGKGWFAEYRDLLGNRLVHPSAGLWTIYHAIDEEIADPFQAYQATVYVDHSIPHIPVKAKGIAPGKFYTLSTTNWMPYTWSINNVALAEVLHTALAYWQAGREQEAFALMKGSFLDYMFMGSSPGNFGQLSYYDAFRGELYRDFADPVGVAARAVIEGLFGIRPDMVDNTLVICPGWPLEWDHASLETPDVKLHFCRDGAEDHYTIESFFSGKVRLKLLLKAKSDQLNSVLVNGRKVEWGLVEQSVGGPLVELNIQTGDQFDITVEWAGDPLEKPALQSFYAKGETFSKIMKEADMLGIYDPQGVLRSAKQDGKKIDAFLTGETGWRTFFVRLRQGQMTWWQPFSFELRTPVEVVYEKEQPPGQLLVTIRNNQENDLKGMLEAGPFMKKIKVPARAESGSVTIPGEVLVPGTNRIDIHAGGKVFETTAVNWAITDTSKAGYEMIDLSDCFNDRITHIFNEQYYSPRSPYPTLSIPVQGIGDWCSYKETVKIDDSGLGGQAGPENGTMSPMGIPFRIAGNRRNIIFTSQWDNYPDSVTVSLTGKASHLYLLMAGSTHHMQSRMENGRITVHYSDGTRAVLSLVNPDNWWPIEQDYYEDGFAFRVNAPRPPRLYLKTGAWHLDSYNVWAKNGTRKIDGGAASVLDLPLDSRKRLKSVTLETRANDVVIGLMAVTLNRYCE